VTQPIGEEFIRIRPDTSTFRAELQAQVAAALRSVQPQIAAAQAQLAASVRATPVPRAPQVQAPPVVAPAAAAAATTRAVAPPAGIAAAEAELTALGKTAENTRRQLDLLSTTRGGVVLPPGVNVAEAQLTSLTATAAASKEQLSLLGTTRGAVVVPAGVQAAETQIGALGATATTTAEQLTLLGRTRGGVVLPAGVRTAQVQLEALGATAKATAAELALLSKTRGGVILPTAVNFPDRAVLARTTEFRKELDNLGQTAKNTAATVTRGGVILPPGIRSLTPTLQQAQKATEGLGQATKKAAINNAAFTDSNRKIQATTDAIHRGVQTAERDVGRYTRGMVAATAASTGFFRAVSFASGAFLLGAAVGATIGAAITEFKQMTIVAARTAALIKATGGAANVTAGQVDALAKRILRLTGVDDELTKQAADVLLTFRLIRNEVGAGNDVFDRATKAVVDISNVFGTDMRSSAIQLGKALQDPIRGVTALRRSGITLTQSQRDLIKAMVESGRILSAQKLILGEVERQVGGTSEAIGRTLPGRLRILREEAKNSLGEYVQRINESRAATELFARVSQGIAQVFDTIRTAVQAIGPPLVGIATGLGRVSQAVGGLGTILAAVAAYKAITIAAGTATAASRVFAAASAGAAQANLVEAAAAGEATVALRTKATAEIAAARSAQATISALTGIAALFAAGSFASGQYTLGVIAAGFALTGLIAKAVAAARAMRAAGLAVSATGIATGALGGPVGIAAIGVGALAFGLLKLHEASRNLPGTLNATRRALDSLNASIGRNINLRALRETRRSDITTAFEEEGAARQQVATRQAAIQTTQAEPGSLGRIRLDFQLQQAEDELKKAINRRIQAQKDLDAVNERLRISEQNLTAAIPKQTAEIQKQISAFIEGTHVKRLFGVPIGFNPNKAFDTHSIDQFIDRFQELGAQGDKTAAAVAAVATVTQAMFERLPTQKEIAIIVRLRTEGASTNQILQALGFGQTGGGRGAEQVRLEGLVGTTISASANEQALAAQAALKAAREQLRIAREGGKLASGERIEGAIAARENLRSAREQLETARESLQTARDQVQAARQSLADAQQGARDARQQLLDTIASAHQAIADAVTSAKGNLDQLGQAIADALNQGASSFATGGAMGARFRELRDQIARGEGGPETQRAAQQIAFELEAKGTATGDFKQQFADLTDAFNRGKITLPQFNRQFNALIKTLDIRAFRRQFGTAATNLLLDEIKTARKQAALIAGGPRRAGGGTGQTLVNPLAAVAAANRQIADAQRGVAAAVRGIRDAQTQVTRANQDLVRAEKNLREAQAKATTANTAAIRANTRAANALARVRTAQDKIDKKKPKGAAGFEAGSLTNSGATTP
jgi:hypothetical protein